MSSRSIPKSMLSVLIGAMLACMCTLAFIVPQKAHADELQAASLEAQSVDLTAQANANLTTAKAKPIKMGSSATVKYDEADVIDEHNSDVFYWFSYRLGKGDCAYTVRVDSVDGTHCYVDIYNENNSWIGGVELSNSLPTKTYIEQIKSSSQFGKKRYVRIKISGFDSVNYGDAFKVTVKKHPVIKAVSGVKTTKKAKNALSLKWSKVSSATKYKVAYKKVGAENWKYKTVKSTKVTLKKLKKNTQYEVQVQAFRKGGWNTVDDQAANWGPWSNSKTYKTKK